MVGWNLVDSYAQLPSILFSHVMPTPVDEPKLILFNKHLAMALGLDKSLCKSTEGVQLFAGNSLPPNANPISQAYAGHQFGTFTKLGDGRAILLGEQITPQGKKVDIQYKGSGPTPYSRGGDGRAALGPMLREYIISEAMHALGLPTTRSLAVVTTGEKIIRERLLAGAILTRVASSHIRIGTFQYVAALGDIETLKKLADYSIDRHDPQLLNVNNPYASFLERVVDRQASLVAKWQLVGFIHGVLNTDNITISGETIDYGPCAFMDTYNRDTVFSSIDDHGRYAYGNQPAIIEWNLARFAEAILPLLHKKEQKAIEVAKEIVHSFFERFNNYWLHGMRKKLGIFTEEKEDFTLIEQLLIIMESEELDYTNTFLQLTNNEGIKNELYFKNWYEKWHNRLRRQPHSEKKISELMRLNNPAVIPRNHLVEDALMQAIEHDDIGPVTRLMKNLQNPYAHTKEQTELNNQPIPNVPYRTFCGT